MDQSSYSRTHWRRSLIIGKWRRMSYSWWRDGAEVDFAAMWDTWVEAHDGDPDAALGHLLLVLDHARLLETERRAS